MSLEDSKPHVFMADITGGQENVKISFINEKNFQTLPEIVSYIPKNILTSESLLEDFESIPIPCNCAELCGNGCSCAFGMNIAFQDGILLEDFITDVTNPVIECSTLCTCTDDCSNRVVQNGIKIQLQVFMTEYKGFGVRTLEFIPKLTFVCEYAGELIDKSEAEKRMKNRSAEEANYVYILKEHSSNHSNIFTIIDPTTYGNVGRYLNHSCSPNLIPIPVRANSLLPKICFFAKCDISPHEELTYNYGADFCPEETLKNCNDSSNVKTLRKCYCQSAQCSGFLPFDTSCLS